MGIPKQSKALLTPKQKSLILLFTYLTFAEGIFSEVIEIIIRITKGGKVIRGHAFARHILTSKASKRKRKLDQTTTVSDADVRHVRAMLPYGR